LLNKLQKGDYFGELALSELKERSATIITTQPCEFITISEEIFKYIHTRYEKTNTKKLNFILDFFPGLENANTTFVFHDILSHLKESSYNINTYLTIQGKTSQTFYILYEGVCNLYLKLSDDPQYNELQKYGEQKDQNKQDGILVCKIHPGMFIGEEILYNKNNKYEFTVKAASSSVQVLTLSIVDFNKAFPLNTIQALKEAYKVKHQHYFSHGAERTRLKSNIMPFVKPHITRKIEAAKLKLVQKENPGLPQEMNFNRVKVSPNKLSIKRRIANFSRLFNLKENTGMKIDYLDNRAWTERTIKSIDWTKRENANATPQMKKTVELNEIIPASKRLDMGDEERLPAQIRRLRNKSQAGDGLNKKDVINIKAELPKLDLKNAQSPERIVLTERIISRLERSVSKSGKQGWGDKLLRSNTERVLKRKKTMETEGDEQGKVFLTEMKFDTPVNKQAMTTRGGYEKRLYTEEGSLSFSNLDYFVTGMTGNGQSRAKLKTLDLKKSKTVESKQNEKTQKKPKVLKLKQIIQKPISKEVNFEALFLSGFEGNFHPVN